MIVIDVNVLVAAYLTGHQFHNAAHRYLSQALSSGEVAIPDVVWSGFIRTVTHPALVQPTPTWPELRSFINAIQHQRGYRAEVRSMASSMETFVILCQTVGARRNKVSDAYIAAIAIDHDAAVATWDTDFDSFPVAVIHPPLDEQTP